MENVSELRVPEDEAAHRRCRFHRGRARAVVDECDLAEEVSGAEASLSRCRVHLGAAFQDAEEVSAALSLLGETRTRRMVERVRARGDRAELLLCAAVA